MLIRHEKIYRKNPEADSERLKNIVKVNKEALARNERVPVILGHTPGSGHTEFLTLDCGDIIDLECDDEFIYADLELDDALEDAIKRHRGKSIELYNDDRIFPLSLLSHNRPALELEGLKVGKFEREGDKQTFILEEEIMPEETKEVVKNESNLGSTQDWGHPELSQQSMENLFAEVLLHSDLAAAVKSLLEEVSAIKQKSEQLDWLFEEDESEEEMVAEDAEVEAEEHPELPKDEIEQIAEDHVAEGKGEEIEKNEGEVGEKALQPQPAENKAPEQPKEEFERVAVRERKRLGEKDKEGNEPEKESMAMASGTNTFIANTKVKKHEYSELEDEVETQKGLVQKYALIIESESKEKNELLKKYQMLERKNSLLELNKKYEFDVDEEMYLVSAMDDVQFDTHKKIIVTRYSCPPVNKAAVNVAVINDDADVIPAREVERIAKYALANKCSWNEAKERMKG
jgi:hypothetical protein